MINQTQPHRGAHSRTKLAAGILLTALTLSASFSSAQAASAHSDGAQSESLSNSGSTSGTPDSGSEASEQSRREEVNGRQYRMMLSTLQAYAQQDEFIEKMTGTQRNQPQFKALKEGFQEVYGDELLMLTILSMVPPDETDWTVKFNREWRLRIASGMGRLSDESAMKLLHPIGAAMGRLSAEQCARYQDPETKRSGTNSFAAILLPVMTDTDVRQLYGAFHDALLADMNKRPLRALPNKTELADVFAAIDRIDAQLRGGAKDATPCSSSRRLMDAVDKAPQPTRSQAITYLLTVTGFYVQKGH